MANETQRSIEELYRDDPERADAEVFGRKTGVNRRGFLGGAGLATMTAAVGGTIPFAANMPGGMIAMARMNVPGIYSAVDGAKRSMMVMPKTF